MKNISFFLLVTFCGCHLLFGSSNISTSYESSYKGWSLFLENKGQMKDMSGKPVPFVLSRSSAKGLDMYITTKGITYVFIDWEKEEESDDDKTDMQTVLKLEEKSYEWERVDIELVGASIKKENIKMQYPASSDYRYFFPHCPDGVRGVNEYRQITIKEIYPGIDWILEITKEGNMKYSFRVQPYADPEKIKLRYIGDANAMLEGSDQIKIKSPSHTLREGKLYCYYENDKKERVSAHYNIPSKQTSVIDDHFPNKVLLAAYQSQEVSISLENRNQEQTLIIDPELEWASFYGGTDGPFSPNFGFEGSYSITTDSKDNVIIVGYTASTDFPVQTSGNFFQGMYGGGNVDAFILKFNNLGELLWATYYGGEEADGAQSVSIDDANNIFIAGHTSSYFFPLQNAGTFFQPANTSGLSQNDIFILEFDEEGNRLWATYYGGSADDVAYSCVIDASNNLYVVGTSERTGSLPNPFPKQDAGTFFQGTHGGGQYDAFILKFDNLGNRLWATLYGGNGNDIAHAITFNNANNIFVVGKTASSNLTLKDIGTYFDGTYGSGLSDAFILNFDSLGNYIWGTYYGGSSKDMAYSCVTDDANNLYVTGTTASDDFSLQDGNGFFQPTYGGGDNDAFILKFDEVGNRLWSTYYGGNDNEGEEDYMTYDNIAIDHCTKDVVITFSTASADIFTKASADSQFYNNVYNGGASDVFITRFTDRGTLLWATYFGGDGKDFRQATTFDSESRLYVTGEWTGVTNNTSYPVTNLSGGYNDSSFNDGLEDLYIARFNYWSSVSDTDHLLLCAGSSTTLTAPSAFPASANTTYLWNTGATTSEIEVSPTDTQTYNLFITDTSSCYKDTKEYFATVNVVSRSSVSEDTTICPYDTILLYAFGGTDYQWSTGENTSVIQVNPAEEQIYRVLIYDGIYDCVDEKFINVGILTGCVLTFIPNAFTPSGANPFFDPTTFGTYEQYELSIYDRFGNLVFYSDDPSEKWNGMYNNIPGKTGVYAYQLILNQTQYYKGNISLLK